MAAGSLTVSITIPVSGGAINPDQTGRLLAVEMLRQCEQAVGSLVATSGNLTKTFTLAAGPVTVGTWSYSAST